MTSTWTDPQAMTTPLRKVAVVCLTKDEGMRRMAEAEAARQVISGAMVVPSYQIISDADLRNREAVKAKLQAEGFDGALVMRMAAVTERFSPIGAPYGTFSGYYDWADARIYSPEYLRTETAVHVISNLYSLRDDKLVWSGTSRTFDTASTKETVGSVSKAVAREIQKDRLIL
jgi:hypothetical protein